MAGELKRSAAFNFLNGISKSAPLERKAPFGERGMTKVTRAVWVKNLFRRGDLPGIGKPEKFSGKYKVF